MKARVYLETSVISYLIGWLNQRSILVAHNQEFTREWWSARRHEYELFSSAVAINEASRGEGPLANERLGFLAETTMLDITGAALSLARQLLSHTRIPAKADVDALHVAVATVHGMDYLLSWNCKHIVNGNILPQVYAVCRAAGFEPPFICTPLELMEP
ncbi:MAG TPA: type II toxin-antitoxin system VapC family toxin [Thermoanaerobaculia bacterium]|nr:type II toxin-antitoxin system VapC family toxin [Thermoanaerobaculia bacterium]